MYHFLLVIYLLVAVSLVIFIMLQQGKSADIGLSSHSGISNVLFSSSSSGNFMTRMTAILATLFFILSLAVNNFNNNQKGSEWDNLNQENMLNNKQTKT